MTLVLMAAPCLQGAEPEPLVTDRPDFVEASTTVGLSGRFGR